MARCTAPVRGHKSAAAAANCPACRYRYGGSRGYSGYSGGYSSYGSSASSSYSSTARTGIRTGGSSARRSTKPRWSSASSTVWYTPEQVLSLSPVREIVEDLAVSQPDLTECFYAMLGTIDKARPRNCTTYLKIAASECGLAKRTSDWECQ